MSLIPLVEGQSEAESVPVLLRRIVPDFPIARPFRIKRNKIVVPGELERAVRVAVSDRPNPSCILLLIDADDDCPAELGPALLDRCERATQLPAAVIVANREIEAWFLGGIDSLRGVRGIRFDASWDGDPEAPRGAKGRLEELMTSGRSYVTVDDQPALMSALDIDLASQRCPSLNKFLRDVKRITARARQ
jgi:hypothetical protein